MSKVVLAFLLIGSWIAEARTPAEPTPAEPTTPETDEEGEAAEADEQGEQGETPSAAVLPRDSLTISDELNEKREAQAKSQGADANYDLLKTRLDRTVVRAPFAGVVGRRLVSIGTFVSNQTPLTSLQSVNPQYASFDVPERYADRLRRGQLVSFQVAALPGKNFSGEVVFVDPVVALPGRTILIKARVPNTEHRLQAGMFIEARLATDIRPNAVVVPEDALLPMQGSTFIWVIKGGKADRRQVSVGVRTAGWAEVQGDVQAGDSVVVGGGERLFPSAPVMARVVERRRGTPAAQESTGATNRPAGGAGGAQGANPASPSKDSTKH